MPQKYRVGRPKTAYRLFLDDERHPPRIGWWTWVTSLLGWLIGRPRGLEAEPWIVVRSYEAAVATIEARGMPQHIAFDHDLGETADGRPLPSGLDVAKWIVEYVLDHDVDLRTFTWYCHSQNPAGARNIDGLLTNLKAVTNERRLAATAETDPTDLSPRS